ncbi:MAG: VOC family protein [Chloroflexi bacterium]|nr:VOC family protein [Chloroflexota bacterium]
MPFAIQHIDHIALTVRDVERATRWYCDVLGFEHRYPGLWGGVPAMLFAGDTGIALFPVRAAIPKPSPASDTIAMMHLAFRVDRAGFVKAQDHLSALGIAFEFQDHDISHSIYFSDPDGHRLEITTYEVPG